MSMKNNNSLRFLFLGFLCLFLVGCGGSATEQKKSSTDVAPQAIVEVLGAAVGNGIARVRSGSDVSLTGQNSKGFDDPILHYHWEQIDTSGFKVEFYERTTNAIAFKAPNLPLDDTKGVNLKFRLTVTDADGVKASSDIELLVQSIKDSNHFLAVPSVDNKVSVYISAAKGETVASNIDVVLKVKGTATWQGRDGNKHQATVMNEEFSGVVPAGKVDSVTGSNNLSFSVPLPELNMDEINKQFTSSSRLSRLEFEYLQEAQLQLSFELQQAAGASLNVYLADAADEKVLDVSVSKLQESGPANLSIKQQKPILTGSGSSVLIDVEELRQALNLESKLSANNYYRCIDPLENAKTFSGWLAKAGFTGKDDGTVNTKYINNYDLGFGRDMYIRQDPNGNVYSYVTNYNTLENTLHNRNEFAIVAMEYSPEPTGNCGDQPDAGASASAKKIVKFFAYIPDAKNGGYIRAESMNFDGRGEKYLPGVCTACHYGNNHTTEFNTNGKILASHTDLDSSFMPWDLDAFLYTNATKKNLIDPAFAAFAKATGLAGAEQEKYSREAQESRFKQQNQMVLHTFTENPKNIPRFAHAITQLHGWYGGTAERAKVEALNFGGDTRNLTELELQGLQQQLKTLPAGQFDGSYVPKGWRGNASQEALYTGVYDRNCRMCHLFTPNVKFDFDNYNEFVNHPSLKNYVYERGIMPLSRLTMDRFWLDFAGGDSAAKKLRDHLNTDSIATNDVSEKLLPGAPVALIFPDPNPKAVADVQIDFDELAVFDGRSSLFANNYRWTVDASAAGSGRKYTFVPTRPGESHVIGLQVSSADGESPIATRSILVADYTPTLSDIPVQSVIEGGVFEINLYSLLCPNAAADDKICRNVFGDIVKGNTPKIVIGDSVKNGVITNVDSVSGKVIFQSTAAKTAGDAEFSLAIEDSFGDRSSAKAVSVIVNSLAAPTIGSPDSCSSSARTTINAHQFPLVFNTQACPDPTANDSAATGLVFKLDLVDATSAKGGQVSVINGVISYMPPSNFVGLDSFNYRIRDNSFTKKVSQGTVNIVLNSTVSFSSISSSINSSCPGCHRTNTSAFGPNWRNYSTFSSSAGGLGSSFMAYACGDPSHLGENRLCNSSLNGASPTSIDQLNGFGQTILTWLEEGGLNN